MPVALVDDCEIAFDDVGSGAPVVFLHAFPLDRTMWKPQLGALGRLRRLLALAAALGPRARARPRSSPP